MYLVDTNIFLEALLRQERAAEVESFFQSIDLGSVYILAPDPVIVRLS